MAVTKKTIGAVLRSGLPATIYVEDFETKRVLESIKTALILLGNILDGKTDDVAIDGSPDTEIEQGQGVKIQKRGRNRFKISVEQSEAVARESYRSYGGGGVDALVDLLDVDLSGLSAGDLLRYTYALKWENSANRTPFAFIQTGAKAGYFVAGKLRLNGTEITPSAITFGSGGTAMVTDTNHYMTVTISTGATAWASGSSFPADTDTTSTVPVAIFTFTGGGDILTYTPVLSDHFVQYGTVPNGTALGQIIHWNESDHRWTASVVGTLADGDMLKWDAGNGKYVKVASNAVPVVSSIASGNLIKWDGSKYVVAAADTIPAVSSIASGDIIKWDGSKFIKLTPTTQTFVTDVLYDSGNHVIQKKTISCTVIDKGSESSPTTITGGQAVVEG